MKKVIMTALTCFIGLFVLNSPAFAAEAYSEDSGCSGETCLPSITNSLNLSLQLGGATAGVGGVVFEGTEGVAGITEVSDLTLNSSLQGSGEACGLDCTDWQFEIDASAMQNVMSEGAVIGNSPGTVTTLEAATSAQTLLGGGLTLETVGASDD